MGRLPFRFSSPSDRQECNLIVLGLILLIIGLVASIPVLYTIGIILLIVGVVLFALGSAGRAVGGRRHYY
ncbi:MAG: hypothetical protein QOF83_4219 [Solirubrobacteraceae bacterium]|jgi:uncharacterized membrane protein|nr:hypothetical protein [Solirubrobacteraceae bacterium]